MSFMELEIIRKGTLYTCDCAKCGRSLYTHEWADMDFCQMRDAMQAGTFRCPDCGGKSDPDTFCKVPRKQYAGWYQAPGYLDCTEWEYDSNKRRLERTLREMYGE